VPDPFSSRYNDNVESFNVGDTGIGQDPHTGYRTNGVQRSGERKTMGELTTRKLIRDSENLHRACGIKQFNPIKDEDTNLAFFVHCLRQKYTRSPGMKA
jgi:hypothetical protein